MQYSRAEFYWNNTFENFSTGEEILLLLFYSSVQIQHFLWAYSKVFRVIVTNIFKHSFPRCSFFYKSFSLKSISNYLLFKMSFFLIGACILSIIFPPKKSVKWHAINHGSHHRKSPFILDFLLWNSCDNSTKNSCICFT